MAYITNTLYNEWIFEQIAKTAETTSISAQIILAYIVSQQLDYRIRV